MTIAVGLRSVHGTILCADTEETGWALKGRVEKVRVQVVGGGRIFGFVGAGTGPLCDFLEQEIAKALHTTPTNKPDADLDLIRRVVIKVHKQYFWPNPAWKSDNPLVGALMVLRHLDRDTVLLRCGDGVVTEHPQYASVGVGADMADYWHRILLPIGCSEYQRDRLIAIAAFVLWQTKQFVPGCGGQTSIASFHPGGFDWGPSFVLIRQLEASFELILRSYGILVGSALNPTGPLSEPLERFANEIGRAVSGPRGYYDHLREFMDGMKHPGT